MKIILICLLVSLSAIADENRPESNLDLRSEYEVLGFKNSKVHMALLKSKEGHKIVNFKELGSNFKVSVVEATQFIEKFSAFYIEKSLENAPQDNCLQELELRLHGDKQLICVIKDKTAQALAPIFESIPSFKDLSLF
jgi:hypothetical protein